MGSRAVALTGKDTIQIGNLVLTDFADENVAVLTFSEDLAVVKAGKDGNLIYAFNAPGDVATLELRLLVGSSDDKELNSRLQEMKSDFSSFTLLAGNVVKRVGDGEGNITSIVYELDGGIFKKNVEVKTSASGDTEQSVSIYTINFGGSQRSLQ